MTGFLQLEPVGLACGRPSAFKIECDSLTDDDMATACALLAQTLPEFGRVIGVPTGGTRVAEGLKPYVTPDSPVWLVADDVWTTGGSMHRFMRAQGIPAHRGAVLFARGPVPAWVTALWAIHPRLWDL